MRLTLLGLSLLLAGCLSTQTPTNTVKKEDTIASVSINAPKRPLRTVDRMKDMYLAQKLLNEDILKLAVVLTQKEFEELNLWLRQFGVQLQKKTPMPMPYDPNEAF